MMKRMWLPVFAAACLVAGCELDDVDEEPVAQDSSAATPEAAPQATPTAPTATNAPTPSMTDDELQWSLIQWRGPAAPNARQVMTLSADIDSDGGGVSFNYDRYPWDEDCLAGFFVWNGANWVGGKFEWIREGGQPYKSLENVKTGYNGHTVPRSGTPVAFAWWSSDGEERSNLAQTIWP